MRKKCEAMAGELGGTKTLLWEGTKAVGSQLEKKYIGLKLNKMEVDWMIFTIDTIELTGCRHKTYQF